MPSLPTCPGPSAPASSATTPGASTASSRHERAGGGTGAGRGPAALDREGRARAAGGRDDQPQLHGARRGRRYFVRIGGDIPEHNVVRRFELAAARAAHAAGVSPAVRHWEEGALVLDFIEGRTFAAEDVREPANLDRLAALLQRCHREMPRHFRGPALIFWVFQVLRDYAHTLREAGSRYRGELPRLAAAAERLEAAVGPVEIVFGHNDLLPANFIDDGKRLWLIDWDYAGFNTPLFDLGGLASNNGCRRGRGEALLEAYFGRAPDAALRRRSAAMKCASLLRETMWSMVSELHSTLDFDYAAYTAENLARFEAAWAAFGRGGHERAADLGARGDHRRRHRRLLHRLPPRQARLERRVLLERHQAHLAARPSTPPGSSASCAPPPTSPSCSATRSSSTTGSRRRPGRPPAGR